MRRRWSARPAPRGPGRPAARARRPPADARRSAARSAATAPGLGVRRGAARASWLLQPAMVDPRIERAVGDVGDEIGHQRHEGRDQQRRQRQVVVVAHDRIVDQLAHAEIGEDGLDDERAREQVADVERHDGDQRQHGVGQSVVDDHGGPRQALDPGRADEVLAQCLEHRGADEADEGAGGEQGQGQDGQDQVARAGRAGRPRRPVPCRRRAASRAAPRRR